MADVNSKDLDIQNREIDQLDLLGLPIPLNSTATLN